MAQEPNDADEAAKLYDKLLQAENDILSNNSALWEKVFLSANKNTPMIEDGTNYGDFLLSTVEGSKSDFSADEYKILKAAAGMAGDASKLMKFPSFNGKDLDGNDVNSSDLFSGNTVTVVNFWFTSCKPCVSELADLEALNKELAAKGGGVVGINSFTLDGNKKEISEAKDILSKKGATYKNIWFDTNSEAGKFTSGLYSYPTTYVVDKNGNIVGQPIVGAITSPEQAAKLNKLIDTAIANSK